MKTKDYYIDKNEKPLDRIVCKGGFAAVFRKIAVIGDSLASGTLESVHTATVTEGDESMHVDTVIEGHECYEYSWPQYLAQMTGSEVMNFSRGGMTAREYCLTYADQMGFWDQEKAADAYIIALGVNDTANYNHLIGKAEDIRKDWRENAESFIGFYGRIIQRYREISPKARFFIVAPPEGIPYSKEPAKTRMQGLTAALHRIVSVFPDVYLIDLHTYAPEYDRRFCDTFFLGDHMSTQGYLLTAKMIASYMDYLIRKHPEAFKEAGLIRTPH